MESIISALVTFIATWLITWRQTKTQQEDRIRVLQSSEAHLRSQVAGLESRAADLSAQRVAWEAERNTLQPIANSYNRVRDLLQKSRMVRSYRQPVLLLGPRSVGKTSLLAQWHSPWSHAQVSPTQTISVSNVPVYDFQSPDAEPHFAMPEVRVPVDIHLALKVFDFPGELSAQKAALEAVKQETLDLIGSTSKNLGVVLICMFDAEEAHSGISQETMNYYNGELFRSLRDLVGRTQIYLDRIVLVFNKYDLLRTRMDPNASEEEVQRHCTEKLSSVYKLLSGVVNPERVCEVFSILSREQILQKNQGAPIVLGEAARSFVEAFAGRKAVRQIISKDATIYSSTYLQI